MVKRTRSDVAGNVVDNFKICQVSSRQSSKKVRWSELSKDDVIKAIIDVRNDHIFQPDHVLQIQSGWGEYTRSGNLLSWVVVENCPGFAETNPLMCFTFSSQ